MNLHVFDLNLWVKYTDEILASSSMPKIIKNNSAWFNIMDRFTLKGALNFWQVVAKEKILLWLFNWNVAGKALETTDHKKRTFGGK